MRQTGTEQNAKLKGASLWGWESRFLSWNGTVGPWLVSKVGTWTRGGFCWLGPGWLDSQLRWPVIWLFLQWSHFHANTLSCVLTKLLKWQQQRSRLTERIRKGEKGFLPFNFADNKITKLNVCILLCYHFNINCHLMSTATLLISY